MPHLKNIFQIGKQRCDDTRAVKMLHQMCISIEDAALGLMRIPSKPSPGFFVRFFLHLDGQNRQSLVFSEHGQL